MMIQMITTLHKQSQRATISAGFKIHDNSEDNIKDDLKFMIIQITGYS